MSKKIDVCKACYGQGQITVVKDLDRDIFLFMCDYCGAQWKDLKSVIECLAPEEGGEHHNLREATFEEIKEKGWDKYFENAWWPWTDDERKNSLSNASGK